MSLPAAHFEAPGFRSLELFVYFFFGAAAYPYRDRVPIRGWIACLAALAVVVALPTRADAAVLPTCFAYAVIYVAMKWPIRSFDRRIDLSYGLYIYAFPIQQLLVIYGFNVFGIVPYFSLTFALTVLLAAASWFIIGKPSLSLKRRPWKWRQA
ncbi:MAG: hypothetical protein ABI231_00435 [Candidatus Tumulicola sp.]